MSIQTAIQILNEASQQQIELHPTRDGRITATLPRVGREVVVQENMSRQVKVTASDIAWLCEEARLALAPATGLLEAALEELKELEPD